MKEESKWENSVTRIPEQTFPDFSEWPLPLGNNNNETVLFSVLWKLIFPKESKKRLTDKLIWLICFFQETGKEESILREINWCRIYLGGSCKKGSWLPEHWGSGSLFPCELGRGAPLNCFNKDLNKFLNGFYGGILQQGVGFNGPGTPMWSSRRSRENKSLWLTQMLISSSSDIKGDELPGNLIFVAIKVSQLWVDSKTAFPLPMLHLLWIFGL